MTAQNRIEVVYEDEGLLVVNKPSGLPTQGTVDKSRANLYEVLKAERPGQYLGLHHRLDAPTSGLVLLTKDETYNKPVSQLFTEKKIQKSYLCLCSGSAESQSFTVTNHLKEKRLPTGKKKVQATTSGGDYAETEFRVLARFGEEKKAASLILAKPKTGRMHQIRVHLTGVNLPILGDALYFRIDRKFPRLMLHAWKLEFKHPFTNKDIEIVSSIPDDFLKQLSPEVQLLVNS